METTKELTPLQLTILNTLWPVVSLYGGEWMKLAGLEGKQKEFAEAAEAFVLEGIVSVKKDESGLNKYSLSLRGCILWREVAEEQLRAANMSNTPPVDPDLSR